MRRVALLPALLLAVPFAAASDVSLQEGHVNAVLCTLDWTNDVDNSFTTLRCQTRDGEVLYYRAGSGFAGPWCESRVLGSAEPSLCLFP